MDHSFPGIIMGHPRANQLCANGPIHEHASNRVDSFSNVSSFQKHLNSLKVPEKSLSNSTNVQISMS